MFNLYYLDCVQSDEEDRKAFISVCWSGLQGIGTGPVNKAKLGSLSYNYLIQ